MSALARLAGDGGGDGVSQRGADGRAVSRVLGHGSGCDGADGAVGDLRRALGDGVSLSSSVGARREREVGNGRLAAGLSRDAAGAGSGLS